MQIMTMIKNNVIKNRLQKLLNETNFKNLTPNNQQLLEMNMSKKRFTHIKQNNGNELTYSEAVYLCEWLKPFFPNLSPWELYEHPNKLSNDIDEAIKELPEIDSLRKKTKQITVKSHE